MAISRNPTMWGVIGIEILFWLIGEAIICLFFSDKLFMSVGYSAGILTCIGLIISMMSSLENAVQYDKKRAIFKMRISASLRVVGVLIVAAALYYFQIANILAYVAALWTLKVAVYLQPITYKLLTKNTIKEGR